jgi:hypothetical protein
METEDFKFSRDLVEGLSALQHVPDLEELDLRHAFFFDLLKYWDLGQMIAEWLPRLQLVLLNDNWHDDFGSHVPPEKMEPWNVQEVIEVLLARCWRGSGGLGRSYFSL